MTTNRRILILAGNFYPEPTGIGKYNGEMVEWLAKNGFKITVITTYPYYPHWKVQKPYTKHRYWFKKETNIFSSESEPVEIIRCPHYVPEQPTGLKRIVSDFSIVFATFLVVLRLLFRSKYHYVMSVAPPFQTGILAVMYKKLKGAKMLYHIQDLQVDAARELGMIKSRFLVNTLFRTERYILRHTDHVSSISDGMIKRIKDKVDKDIHFLPNWVETDKFFPISDKETIRKSFGFSASDKIILYSGAIGHKQGIELLIHVAGSLKSYPNFKFVICGVGPYKINLIRLKENLGLTNIVFLPLQPHEKFNEFLNIADLHLILQKAGANDLVMPSKLSTILAVGGAAIVTAEPGTGLYNYVAANEIGILVDPDNESALKEIILSSLCKDQLRIRSNARRYATSFLSINSILSRYIHEITAGSTQTVVQSNPVVVKYSNSIQ